MYAVLDPVERTPLDTRSSRISADENAQRGFREHWDLSAIQRTGKCILVLATLLDADDLALRSSKRIDVTAHDAHSVAAVASASRDYPLRVC